MKRLGTDGFAVMSTPSETMAVIAPVPKSRQAPPLKPVGFLKNLGPGLVTGAADDDPSGIATYSQVGAQFGYAWPGQCCSAFR